MRFGKCENCRLLVIQWYSETERDFHNRAIHDKNTVIHSTIQQFFFIYQHEEDA